MQHNEWRFSDESNIQRLKSSLPQWQGENISGQHILIWSDQGLGDQIMYSGLLPLLLSQGAVVSVFADPRLQQLFQSSFELNSFYSNDEHGLNEIRSMRFNYQISFGTLPTHIIHSFNDFGEGDAYLQADQASVESIRSELQLRFPGRKLLGFGWRGGVVHTRSHCGGRQPIGWEFHAWRREFMALNDEPVGGEFFRDGGLGKKVGGQQAGGSGKEFSPTQS